MSNGERLVIVMKRPDDLQSEWHAGVIDAARYRDCRMRGQRDHVGERQPSIIILLRASANLRSIQLLPRERRDRRSRREDHVVLGERGLEALEDARLFGL